MFVKEVKFAITAKFRFAHGGISIANALSWISGVDMLSQKGFRIQCGSYCLPRAGTQWWSVT
jgi:drug/metabolite transporter superfamily protein YnfA